MNVLGIMNRNNHLETYISSQSINSNVVIACIDAFFPAVHKPTVIVTDQASIHTRDAIVAEAKNKAQAEANKIMAQTRESINNEKIAAISELKNQVAAMSIEIAEKILRQELSNDEKQKNLMDSLMKDVSLN